MSGNFDDSEDDDDFNPAPADLSDNEADVNGDGDGTSGLSTQGVSKAREEPEGNARKRGREGGSGHLRKI